ncbi:MAG: hypothetical protein QXR00_04510, partial [Candidatus Bathyarchaeia archaeon]
LMNFSLSDIPDAKERGKSIRLLRSLFNLLRKEVNKTNMYAAMICGTTTFIAGALPIAIYMLMSPPLNVIFSIAIINVIIGVFLVYYRSRKTLVDWKITLIETVIIFVIASIISLILGNITN